MALALLLALALPRTTKREERLRLGHSIDSVIAQPRRHKESFTSVPVSFRKEVYKRGTHVTPGTLLLVNRCLYFSTLAVDSSRIIFLFPMLGAVALV